MTTTQIWFVMAIVAVLLPIIWTVATANRFVSLKNHIHESWSNVDVCLKRRYDLIPNLVESVKGYAHHEQDVLARVTEARQRAVASTGAVRDQAADENQLVQSVNQLLARVEAYPDLKASAKFLQLQQELVNTEDRIAAARRFYNGNVREYNTLRAQVPSALIAWLMGYGEADYFEVEDLAVRVTPQVQFR